MAGERPSADRSASSVLIVDDETTRRQELALLLTSAGFDVRQAAGATETDEELAKGGVGIVLVDADMPDIDGFVLCSRIRKAHGRSVYLILRTAKDRLLSTDLNVDEGADDFLIEPFSDKEVLARLETGRKLKQLQGKLTETSRSLARLEVTDSLTGAYNRERTFREIERELERARRYGRPVSLLLVDIDGLHVVNDELGRTAGDRALEEVARVLRLSTRATDTVGRYGGEEFLVVLAETGREQALGAAEKLRNVIAKTTIALADRVLNVTVSIGVATFEDNNYGSGADLVGAAGEALAKAKAAGRNQCEAAA